MTTNNGLESMGNETVVTELKELRWKTVKILLL